MSNLKSNLIVLLQDTLLRVLGADATNQFTIRINTHYQGIPTFAGLDDFNQIESINNFWRAQLMDFCYDPNLADLATQIRTWLDNPSDVGTYANTFEKHWLELVIKIGLLQ